ncbi:MAG: hypothetical protein P8Z35_10870 [Ignavibacteriaceae bacterium]
MPELRNEYLCLEIQKPGENYSGARFDWSGQIIQINFLNKHTFCTRETLNKFNRKKHGRGLYNEFGIDQPVGYNDCPVDGFFPKIGIGLLKKKSLQPYDFFENYKIEPFDFSTSFKKDSAFFNCKTNNNRGYSFELKKQIVLDKNKFTISYSLFNSGSNTIQTNEYVHNFLSINENKIDENYVLFFSFPLNPENFTQSVNPGNSANFKKDYCTWRSFGKEQFFFSNINTMHKGKENWTLIHLKDKVGISESAGFIIQKVNLWGASHVISPEIFFQIDVQPGETITWSRLFEIFDFSGIQPEKYNFLSMKNRILSIQN